MTDMSRSPIGPWLATAQHARVLMTGTTCATGALAPTQASVQGLHAIGAILLLCVISAATVVVHLRHAFLAIGDVQRPFPRVTFGLLTALVYVPMAFMPEALGISQVFFIASTALLLEGWVRAILMAGPIIVTTALAATASQTGPASTVAKGVEIAIGLTVLSACLVGVTQLVRAVDQLDRTRSNQSKEAAERERVRLSRDLHDLLGQSLSALSLKGDLAAALLASDTHAARVRDSGIATLARGTLRSMRQITVGAHTVSLSAEANGAGVLLAAAGIETRSGIELFNLEPDIEDTLAWATREGVTNVLRHSDALVCSITAGRVDDTIFLEIVNDGVPRRTAAGEGNGLIGLAQRAAAVGGTAVTRQDEGGRFCLRIEIPNAAK